MFKDVISIVVALFFVSFGAAAEDSTLFDSAVATGPFSDGQIVFTSEEISNNSGMDSVKITIRYESIDPKPCDCQFLAVLQEEIVSGVWSTLAASHEVISSDDNAPTRIIEVTPVGNANPGFDEFIDVNGGTRISRTQGKASETMRLVVEYLDTNNGALPGTEIILSAYSRTFNTN